MAKCHHGNDARTCGECIDEAVEAAKKAMAEDSDRCPICGTKSIGFCRSCTKKHGG